MKIGNLKWRKIASAALAGMILLSSLPAFSAQEREPLVSSVQENSESDALRLGIPHHLLNAEPAERKTFGSSALSQSETEISVQMFTEKL